MKWIKWVAAYAAVVFTGGTMQSINTIPYPDPMKDGHEFTRDVMAGVLLKTSIEDAFAGVPMFGRYADMFNFQKAVNPSIESRMNATMITTNENKLREIAWLPALHFSAEAGELEQVSFEWPIETFGPKSAIVIDPSRYYQPFIHGVAHTENDSLILYAARPKYDYRDENGKPIAQVNNVGFYAKESAPTALREIRGTNNEPFYISSRVISYNGTNIVQGSNGHKTGLFKLNDSMKAVLFRENYGGIEWIMGSIISTSGKMIDLDTGHEMASSRFDALRRSLEGAADWEVQFIRKYQMFHPFYQPRNAIGRFSNFSDYQPQGMVTFIRNHPNASKESIALERIDTGSLDKNKLAGLDIDTRIVESADIVRYNSGVGYGTYAISKDFQGYEDTGVPLDSTGSKFRSHNYFYVDKITEKYRYKLRNNPVYGNKHYIEKGRAWQH